jgi:hypothetical protein
MIRGAVRNTWAEQHTSVSTKGSKTRLVRTIADQGVKPPVRTKKKR